MACHILGLPPHQPIHRYGTRDTNRGAKNIASAAPKGAETKEGAPSTEQGATFVKKMVDARHGLRGFRASGAARLNGPPAFHRASDASRVHNARVGSFCPQKPSGGMRPRGTLARPKAPAFGITYSGQGQVQGSQAIPGPDIARQ